MALDLHLAKSEKEAELNFPIASFNQTLHATIFHRKALPKGMFPLFRRMESYYDNAKYSGNEIELLLKELRQIKFYFQASMTLKQLDKIIDLCKRAIEQNLSIWVYCD